MSSEAHSHTHVHTPHTHDYVAANQAHFNAIAESFDEFPGAKELAKRVVNAMLTKFPGWFNEDTTTAMDFACGTGKYISMNIGIRTDSVFLGLISRELIPHVNSIVGVDITQGLVDQYNLRVSNQGLEPSEMKAIRTELKQNDEQLGDTKFDVIVCSASYHHLEDVEGMTRTLVSYLKPGGALLVADVMKRTDGREIFHKDHHHVVAHTSGFGEDDMKGIFTQGGLGDYEFSHIFSAKLGGHEQDVFLAKGVKPA
ncbi:hypothetical protein QCA50_007569 [Cerrena zonata]|uniref:Methyltransferase type 12 domain-containing protein n=1 Tax=Cerrena zonata TaxID=2478898 RepID=A0AAW0GFJ2_9APHY